MSLPRLLPFVLIAALATTVYFVTRSGGSDSRGIGGLGSETEEDVGLQPGDRGNAALSGVEADPLASEAELESGSRVAIESKALEEERVQSAIEVLPDATQYKGLVLDSFGLPVMGAEVKVGSLRLEDAVRVNVSIGSKIPFYTTQTKSDGTFVVDIKEPTGLEVGFEIQAKGYQILKGRRAVEGLHIDDLGGFVLEAGVVVAGRVVDETGGPIFEASVYRTAETLDNEASAMTAMAEMGLMARPGSIKTDKDGRFELPHEKPGLIKLAVEHARYLPTVVEARSPANGMDMAEWVIALEVGETIKGRLSGFPKGRKGVRVAARQLDGERIEEATGAQGGMGKMIKAVMNPGGDFATGVESDGSFEFIGLPKDANFELRAFEPDNFVEQRFLSPKVQAKSGDAAITMPYDSGSTVAFRVIDKSSRKPITKFDVKAIWGDENQRLFYTASSAKRRDRHPKGEVTLHEVRPPKTPDVMTLRVRAVGYFDGWKSGILVGEGSKIDAGVLALEKAPTRDFLVLDARTKEPIHRARVSLVGRSAGFSSLFDGTEEEEPRATINNEDKQTHKRATNKTNAKGQCEVTLFQAESATLKVNARGYCELEEKDFPLAPDSSEHTILLSKGATIEFSVVDGEGTAVGGALVIARDRKPFRWTEVESNGRIKRTRVLPGAYAFRAQRGERSDGRRRWDFEDDDEYVWQELTVRSGEVYEVILGVDGLSEVRGQVFASGKPLPGAKVALSFIGDEDPGEEVLEFVESMGGRYGPSSETDDEGRFMIRGVNPGYHRIRARHPDFAMSHQEKVQVGAGENRVQLTMPQTGVAGLLTDASGKPVAGAQVFAEHAPKDGEAEKNEELNIFRSIFSGQMPHVRTDENGEYTLRGLRSGSKLRVRAKAEGFVLAFSESFTLATDQMRTETNLRLSKAGSIEIRVEAEETPQGLLFAEANYMGEERPKPPNGASMLSTGNGKIDGLAPGLWEVKVTQQKMDQSQEKYSPEPVLVTVTAGESVVAVVPMGPGQ